MGVKLIKQTEDCSSCDHELAGYCKAKRGRLSMIMYPGIMCRFCKIAGILKYPEDENEEY